MSTSELVPMLLYATTGGAPYERYEIDRLQGPEWPSGWIEFRTRLFAEDGTVVEQSFAVIRQEDGRLGLVYGYPTTDDVPTTENGQAVPVPYSFLDGEVTFAAAPPWNGGGASWLGRRSDLRGLIWATRATTNASRSWPTPCRSRQAASLARLPPTPRRSPRASGPTPISRPPLRWR